jgi:hypothetical protein
MKKILLTATALVLCAGMATAQNATAGAGAVSGSNSSVTINNEGSQAPQNVFEGADVPEITPGMGGVSGNSTAHCVIANGFGVVGPGAGVQFLNGRISKDCMTEREAGVLMDLLSRPNSQAKTAAIRHFCENDETMRDTLTDLGYCATAPAAATASAPQTVAAAYGKCELADGQIRMTVRAGQDRGTAVEQCKAKLGF